MLEPGLDQVKEKLQNEPIVPVYRRFIADTVTPVSAYLSLTEGGKHQGLLLESVEKGEQIGRYTFVSVQPKAEIIHKNDELSVQGDCKIETSGDPFQNISQLIDNWNIDTPKELPSLTGGLVGYIGYEMVRYIESTVPVTSATNSGELPDSYLYLVDSMLIFDHVKRACYLVGHIHRDGNKTPEAQYEEVSNRIESWYQRLHEHYEGTPVVTTERSIQERVSSNFSRERFKEAVRDLKQSIRSGEIFQVVPSQRFDIKDNNDPFNVYRQLRSVNPSPYMYFLDFDDFQLIGSSPEILVQKDADTIRVRPIAGTRRRGESESEDKALEQELIHDDKELAEHTMLVDLGRNDIGRVSRGGSVEVTDQAVIERYSHVMHLVSNVTGELKPDLNAIDVLKATFPAGTVTGAPKVRAMKLINDVETDRRGPYAGAVGYISYSGDMDTCIVIRTIIARDDVLSVQAGAGIVADSQPDREYEETREKAEALIEAIDTLPQTEYV